MRTVLTGFIFAVSMFLFIMFLANRQGDYFPADIGTKLIIFLPAILYFLEKYGGDQIYRI